MNLEIMAYSGYSYAYDDMCYDTTPDLARVLFSAAPFLFFKRKNNM